MAGRDVIRDHLSLSGGLTVLVAVLLLAPVIGVAWAFPLLSGILLGVGLAAIVYRRLTGTDSGGGSVWNAIPSRQYDGRHAESGGLARGEQEAAIEEIQEQAAERERER